MYLSISVTEDKALMALAQFVPRWDAKYPNISRLYCNHWQNVNSLFDYSDSIRKTINTTSVIESPNSVISKVIKKRKPSPHDDQLKVGRC